MHGWDGMTTGWDGNGLPWDRMGCSRTGWGGIGSEGWIDGWKEFGVEWMRPLVGSFPYILLHAWQDRSLSVKQL